MRKDKKKQLEYQREWQRKWREKNRDKLRAYYKQWRLDHLESERERQSKYSKTPRYKKRRKEWEWNCYRGWRNNYAKLRRKFDIKVKIRDFTHKNLEKDSSCRECGMKRNLQFHHKIYIFPPKQEEITTLCINCHRGIHNEKMLSES